MQLTPEQRKFLDSIGINSTRLQWKLYQWEKKVQTGPRFTLPASLQWLTYPNKFCLKCHTLVNRDETICPNCNSRVYSMWAYRIFRLLGLMVPEGAAPMITVFLFAMVVFFGIGISLDGLRGLMAPTRHTLLTLGAWSPLLILEHQQYWRELSFGLVHIGLIHILFNAFALVQLGPLIESQIGPRRMMTVITATQLTSAWASHLWYQGVADNLGVVSAGASGWLFGLIGFGIAYFKVRGGPGRVYTQFLTQWAIYGILFGVFMGANNAAHIGGMLGGIILGVAPEPSPVRNTAATRLWDGSYWLCVALWLITIAFMGYSILTTGKPPVTP